VSKLSLLFLIWIAISLTSCIPIEENYAPVTEISIIEPIPKNGMHKVLSDETLYSIAWRYGLDYSVLAKRNNIAPPYSITAGQWLYLTKDKPRVKPIIERRPPKKPEVITKTPIAPAPPVIKTAVMTEREPTSIVRHWNWPALGPTIGGFSSSNKGINIAGHRGDPVFATAAGKVVYSGHGLRGYGNLIIIKHNSMFLTAYAHNNNVFVKGGEWVTAGQKIADIGSTGAERVMLHFEIRRNGKPVNPFMYLGKRM
jgi:lipoprotein NlpD